MALSVHPLNVGDLELDESFVNWQINCGSKKFYPTTAWLIQGAGDPILVDTSFRSVADAARLQWLTARRSPEQEIEAQLQRHGLGPRDIKTIIHTHVHMDHAGQDHLFPSARIMVQRKELQNAAAPDIYPIPFYDRLNVARLVDQLWPSVEILDGECEPFAGVRCIPMPGHTPGHQALYVATQSGTTIICGDAAMNLKTNVEQQIPPGFIDDMAATMQGLRRLRKDGVHILPAHDPDIFKRYSDGVR